MRAPAWILALPLLAGAVAGVLLSEPPSPLVAAPPRVPASFALLAAAGAAVALAAGICSCADRLAEETTLAIVVGATLSGLSLGISSGRDAYHPSLLEWFQAHDAPSVGPLVLEGVLREDAAPGGQGVLLSLDVTHIGAPGADARLPVRGGVRLSVAGTLAPGHAPSWRAGRLVRLTATLRLPPVYLNPGVPDERRALARRGIALVGTVKSAALVEVVAPGSRMPEMAAAVRAWTRTTLAATVGVWSSKSAAVATAILIGDRTGLEEDDERRLQEAGTYHVIAISGGNIAMLAALVLGVLRLGCVPARSAALGTIVLLLFYGRITGPAPSVDRAIAVAVVYLSGRILDVRGSALNVLGIAVILAIAQSPLTPLDPGFALSFGATLGILAIAAPMIERLIVARPRSGSFLRPAAGLLAATAAAEIVLAPIGAALFSRITFAGLLLNFAAIPLMGLVQAAGILTLAVRSLDLQAAQLIGYVVHLSVSALVESARLVEVAPCLTREVGPPAWWLVVAYYGSVLLALCVRRVARPASATAAAAGLLILYGAAPFTQVHVAPTRSGLLRIVFLDVGQGDATVVELPDGRTLLIDAGGLPRARDDSDAAGSSFDIGRRVVAPALRALGVSRLDTLVITHGDPDHIGGVESVARSFRPRHFWEGVPVPPHAGLRAIFEAASASGAVWRRLQAGDVELAAGVEIQVLHPPLPDWERQRVRNGDSVVLAFRLADVQIVLPGDIGREEEALIVRALRPVPLTILKAPHHGSAGSSSPGLLGTLRPAAVIFSAGRASPFGHPAPVVVARYRAMGSRILSTADDGAVLLETDGREVWLKGWSSGREIRVGWERD